MRYMMGEYSQDFCQVERFMIEWHAFIFENDPELTEKHETFQESFAEKFKLLCGGEAVLKKWH